ncbi:hypothetical protein NXS19_005551 [Fusarium pseudograminearum]|nr:hypothetical protein NXS19_005551 [Fusarium pseudograminearum]
MPPALSEEENSDLEEFTTPPHATRKKSTSAVVSEKFVVEAIKKHLIDEDGSLKFQVKWEGYDAKKDLTWEPEDNLRESAQEILDKYFNKLGGREKLLRRRKPRPKRRNAAELRTALPTPLFQQQSDLDQWSPPVGSWEDEIESIELEEDESIGKIIVYLRWKNGKKTKHDTDVVYRKCPQKMLRFYESHLKIDRGENREVTEGAEN